MPANAPRFDRVAVHLQLSAHMDSEIKSGIPYRSPWTDCRTARRLLGQSYDQCVTDLAEQYGVSESKIRKAGPGVAPFLSSVSRKFNERDKLYRQR